MMKEAGPRADFSICTANVTAWGSFKKWFDGTPDEDKAGVYLLQETKICGKEKVREANAWCLARGFSSHFCEAVATDKGGVSAGTAILWRRHLEVAACPATWADGRLIEVAFRSADLGFFFCYSVYGWTGVGWKDQNVALYHNLCQTILNHGKPYLVGGDHNMQVQDFFGHIKEQLKGATAVVPARPTWWVAGLGSTIDFFFGEGKLCQALGRIEEGRIGLATHVSQVVVFEKALKCKQVLTFKKVHAGSTTPVVGPMPQRSPQWEQLVARIRGEWDKQCVSKEVVNGLTMEWEELAHCEAAGLFGRENQAGLPFKLGSSSLQSVLCTKVSTKAVPSVAGMWLCRRLQQLLAASKAKKPKAWTQAVGALQSSKAGRAFKFHSIGQPGLRRLATLALMAFAGSHNGVADYWLDSSIQALKVANKLLIQVEWAEREGSWKQWVEEALVGGAKKAHAWVKGKAGHTQVELVPSIGGGLTSCPVAILLAQHTKWKGVWEEKEQAAVVSWPKHEVPIMEVEYIKKVSLSFKKATTAVCGWHPRQYAYLPEICLQGLAYLFGCYEVMGAWASCQRSLMVLILPKPVAGFRPILQYRSGFRVWAKCAQPRVKLWQAENCCDSFHNNLAGRRVGDAVWRSTMRNMSREVGVHTAEILMDVSMAFDRVSHSKLINEAHRSKYPLGILRLSIDSYLFERALVAEGLCSPLVFPTRGLGPGSAFAVFELAMMVTEDIRQTMVLHPSVTISLHVDDVSIQASNSDEKLLARVVQAASAEVIARVERGLNLTFAPAKANLLCTSPVTSTLLLQAMGGYQGEAARVVKRLGYDYTVMRTCRRGPVAKQRWKIGASRLRKAERLRTKKVNYAKVFFAGVLPCASFGAELWGMASKNKNKLRVQALKALGLLIKGAPQAIQWALLPPHQDPGLRMDFLPLERYSREVWLRHSLACPTDALEIQEFWECHSWGVRMVSTKSKGPMVETLRSCERAGWKMVSPFTIKDRAGADLDLRLGSPRMLRALYCKDHRAQELEGHCSKFSSEHPEMVVAKDEKYEWGEGFCFQEARALLASKAVGLRMSKQQKHCLRAALAGGLVTGTKLFARGAIASPLCPYGCQVKDDLFHRLWECSHSEEQRAILPAEFVQQMISRGRADFGAAKLWWLGQKPLLIPEDPQYRFFNKEEEVSRAEFCWEKDKLIFIDGSAMAPSDHLWASAGSAAVQIDEEGVISRAAIAAVPGGFPQTAAAGEHLAALLVDQAVGEPAHLVGDCSSMIRSASHLLWARMPQRPWAGIWKQVQHQHRASKVKAHQKMQADWSAQEKEWYLGNEQADKMAKKAANMFAPLLWQTKDRAKMIHTRKALLVWAAKALSSFKTYTEWVKEGVVAYLDRAPKSRASRPKHTPFFATGKQIFVCTKCCYGAGSKAALELKPCEAILDKRREVLVGMESMGHQVVLLGELMVFCDKCGCYAEGGAGRNLRRKCLGKASTQHIRLPLLRDGRHPIKKVHLGQMEPLYLNSKKDWAGARDRPEDQAGPVPESMEHVTDLQAEIDLQEREEGEAIWGDDFWQH